MHLGQGTTIGSKILAEDKDQTTIDLAVTDNNTITSHLILLHAKIMTLMLNKSVIFAKRATVQKQV